MSKYDFLVIVTVFCVCVVKQIYLVVAVVVSSVSESLFVLSHNFFFVKVFAYVDCACARKQFCFFVVSAIPLVPEVKAAIKVSLLSEKAVDVDYLTFKLNEKLKEKGESLELDENDNIKGWNDKLSGLKTQFPTMFESASTGNDGFQVLGNNKLPTGDGGNVTVTKEQFLNMGYNDRLKLKQENEQLYKQLAKN